MLAMGVPLRMSTLIFLPYIGESRSKTLSASSVPRRSTEMMFLDISKMDVFMPETSIRLPCPSVTRTTSCVNSETGIAGKLTD